MLLYIFYLTIMLIVNISFVVCFKIIFKKSLSISPIGGWILGLFYFICLPLTLITINHGYTIKFGIVGDWGSVRLNDPSYFWPFIFITTTLILVSILCTNYLRSKNNNIKITDSLLQLSNKGLKKIIFLTLFISLVSWTIGIWSEGSLVSYFIKNWYLRGQNLYLEYGNFYVFLSYSFIVNQIIFIAASVLFIIQLIIRKENLLFNKTLYLISLSFIIEMIMSGNRINIAVFGLLFLFILFQLKSRKYILIILLLLPLAITFFSLWSSLRGSLSDVQTGLEANQTRLDTEGNPQLVKLIDATDASGVILLFQVIRDFGNKHEYLFGSTYIRTFYPFVPFNILGREPEIFTIQLAKIFEGTNETSLSATIIGEAYANFGIFALPFFLILTFFFLKFTSLLNKKNRILIFHKAVFFILIIEAIRYSFSVILVLSIILIIFIKLFPLNRILILDKSKD